MSLLKSSLFASAGLVFGMCAATAQTAERTPVSASSDEARELDTVLVVGQAQTYSSVETTEAMALQQSPVTSILAQVDNLPGVLVQEGDAFGFDDWSTGIAVRGFQNNLGSQELGITIDGMPNGNSNYGGGAKANRYIDTMNAGAIDVSQGTADIASRSNEALGGTLNFTSNDPEDERRIRFSASLGDHESQRFYGRYDSGLLADNATKFWVSVSSQSATDFMEGSAQNERDHFAAKLMTTKLGIDWTAYASYDDTHEDNYQRIFSDAEWQENPNWDRLIGEWTDTPYVNQVYRKGWSTLRENSFLYLKGATELAEGLELEAGVYRHDNDGRGDWVPPYLVNVGLEDTMAGAPETEYLGGERIMGGSFLGQIFFVDPTGVALAPADGCISSITFPYGGAGAAYDPACYPDNAIPVQSYRHTHYQKSRTGLYADVNWTVNFGEIENQVRGGIWYEDATRHEYRDWHKITDARIGYEFDELAYWVQYSREFPQTTFKWYVEDIVTVSDFTFRLGLKQFNNEIERIDNFDRADVTKNFTLDTESEVLLSGGAAWAPSALPGVELFAGYSENYKAIADSVLEVFTVNEDGSANVPDPETSENIEVGARYSGDRLRGSIVYFDSSFENRLLQVANQTVDGIDYLEASNGGFVNGGGIESSGFELSGEFLATDWLSLFASYTNLEATILGSGNVAQDAATGITVLDDDGNIVSTIVGNTVPGIAENMFVISADVTQGSFYGGMSMKYVDDRFVNNSNSWTADGYYDADLYIGASGEIISSDLTNVDFRLNVNNLFDEDWISGISGGGAWISSPRTVVFTATVDF